MPDASLHADLLHRNARCSSRLRLERRMKGTRQYFDDKRVCPWRSCGGAVAESKMWPSCSELRFVGLEQSLEERTTGGPLYAPPWQELGRWRLMPAQTCAGCPDALVRPKLRTLLSSMSFLPLRNAAIGGVDNYMQRSLRSHW